LRLEAWLCSIVAVFDSVSAGGLLANVRVADVMMEDLCTVCVVSVAAKGALNNLDGECSTAKLRDDDAKALRQVCAAILRFADEPISIQTGSREGAEGQVRE
jgi:hypothetical protein